jgi:hypothetical protein
MKILTERTFTQLRHNKQFWIYKIYDTPLIIQDYFFGDKIQQACLFDTPKEHVTQISGAPIYQYVPNNSNFEKIYNFFQILNKIIEPDRLGILEALSDDTFVIDLF